MAAVWYTIDVRNSALDSGDNGITGLTPSWQMLRRLSDGANVTQPGISEHGFGQYKFLYDAETLGEAAGRIDVGNSVSNPNDRYQSVMLTLDSGRIQKALPDALPGTVNGLPTSDANNKVQSKVMLPGDLADLACQKIANLVVNGGPITVTAGQASASFNANALRAALGMATNDLDDQLDVLMNGITSVGSLVDVVIATIGTTGVVINPTSKTGFSLAAGGVDAIVIETGVANVVNDAGTTLTSVNLRQMVAAIASAILGVLGGAGTQAINTKPVGRPGASSRVESQGSVTNTRQAMTIRVPN